jgi:hypothetical protein
MGVMGRDRLATCSEGPHPDAAGGGVGPSHEGGMKVSLVAPDQAGRLIGSSEPGPCGVSIAVQVPLGTSFQALPW